MNCDPHIVRRSNDLCQPCLLEMWRLARGRTISLCKNHGVTLTSACLNGALPVDCCQVAMRALGFEPKKEEIQKMISDVDATW